MFVLWHAPQKMDLVALLATARMWVVVQVIVVVVAAVTGVPFLLSLLPNASCQG